MYKSNECLKSKSSKYLRGNFVQNEYINSIMNAEYVRHLQFNNFVFNETLSYYESVYEIYNL